MTTPDRLDAPTPMTTMTPEALEYERAAAQFAAARGQEERDAARRRWDAAKLAMDKAVAEHRDAYARGYEDGQRSALRSLVAENKALREDRDAIVGLARRALIGSMDADAHRWFNEQLAALHREDSR